MKKFGFLLALLFSIHSSSQEIIEDAWVFLKDKPNATTFIENPLKMLSQRAIIRRNHQNVPLDDKDVPIYADYYNQLKNDGTIIVLGKSKWLNAIHIQGTVVAIQSLLSSYSFVASIEFANRSLSSSAKNVSKTIHPNHYLKFSNLNSNFNYGGAENQIKMLKGDVLHREGLTGKDQIIAIIDAGFPNVNTLDAFKRIRENNQILGGYNFADRNTNFYTRHHHGTHVLSTIAGYIEDEYVGTAPDAKFYLFISEIAESETVLEETLWVEAAERADSLGVDVINTSLGYTTFDNPNYSYTYADMDGKTTFISRGAEIAASRGILVVNSAGNSGNSTWKYIGAPADAPSVISVGAIDASGNIASFSSFGPTSDGRIKPEILGQGANSTIINFSTDQISTSSGTSFSAPIMAGLIACLNQQVPLAIKNASKKAETISRNGYLNQLLKRGVFESADKYKNPNNQYGYGIPNFVDALSIYHSLALSTLENESLSSLKISPNPVKNGFSISNLNSIDGVSIQIFNILGKKVIEVPKIISNQVDISNLSKGIYLLKIRQGNFNKTVKLIKE